MASQIAEGYFLLNKNTLRGYLPGDLTTLAHELDKIQRTVRAETVAQDDAMGQQTRQRKLGRLQAALQIVQTQLTTRR
jgi:hypothetical protein